MGEERARWAALSNLQLNFIVEGQTEETIVATMGLLIGSIGLMAEPIEIPAEWTPASYKPDGRDTITLNGELNHWVYIYLTDESSKEQMIATAMQVALDTFQEHGGDVVLVAVMEGPGEDYPMETVTFHPKGCPPSKDCNGGVWESSLAIPPAVLTAMDIPTREQAPQRRRPEWLPRRPERPHRKPSKNGSTPSTNIASAPGTGRTSCWWISLRPRLIRPARSSTSRRQPTWAISPDQS